MNNELSGGAFQVARKIFVSEIWLNKPSTWKVIWIYILGKVNHGKNGKYERGEGYFNFTQEARSIGIDITTNMIKEFFQYARSSSMVATTRTTRGVVVKILNYNKYQTLNNYLTNTTSTTSETREKHERNTTINKNDKNKENIYMPKLVEFIAFWNSRSGTNRKPRPALLSNFTYWLETYSLADIKKAAGLAIKIDPFWKDKITPEILLRTKNPRGEPVDYIGQMLDKYGREYGLGKDN